METVFYEISNLTIMEVHVDEMYEYYARAKSDTFDYFHFAFGIYERFEKDKLENLFRNGYFEKIV